MAPVKRLIARVLTELVVAATLLSPALAAPPLPLARLTHDVEIAELLTQLRDHAPYGHLRVDNVRLVDPHTLTVTPQSTIIVRDARITWAGKTADLPNVADVIRIDGRGRFAVPGLSDMHIHSS